MSIPHGSIDAYGTLDSIKQVPSPENGGHMLEPFNDLVVQGTTNGNQAAV